MIVGWKLRLSTLSNSKNCSPDVVANTLCVCEKTDKIWFVANGWPNITRNARWSAFSSPNEAFVAIVGRKLRLSTLVNSKNCSPDVVVNTLCVCKKPDKIWFVANGRPNITRNAHWSAFASPNKAFASCSHYITHLFIRSIHLCGQGLRNLLELISLVFCEYCFSTIFVDLRGRSDKYLAYKWKTKILEKWRFISQHSLL